MCASEVAERLDYDQRSFASRGLRVLLTSSMVHDLAPIQIHWRVNVHQKTHAIDLNEMGSSSLLIKKLLAVADRTYLLIGICVEQRAKQPSASQPGLPLED